MSDNPFLASFLGCAFALVIWTVVVRAWLVAKFREISGELPESARRAAEVQGAHIAHKMAGMEPPPVPPELLGCIPCQFKQIGDEAPNHDAAWMVECVCGWASFARTADHARALYAKHKPLLVGPRGAPPEVGHGG